MRPRTIPSIPMMTSSTGPLPELCCFGDKTACGSSAIQGGEALKVRVCQAHLTNWRDSDLEEQVVEQLARHLGVYAGLVVLQQAAQQREVLVPPIRTISPFTRETKKKKKKRKEEK